MFNDRKPPRLWITSDDEEFDPTIVEHFTEEGFNVSYLPYAPGKTYVNDLKHLAEDLEMGEKYAIVGVSTNCLLARPILLMAYM